MNPSARASKESAIARQRKYTSRGAGLEATRSVMTQTAMAMASTCGVSRPELTATQRGRQSANRIAPAAALLRPSRRSRSETNSTNAAVAKTMFRKKEKKKTLSLSSTQKAGANITT